MRDAGDGVEEDLEGEDEDYVYCPCACIGCILSVYSNLMTMELLLIGFRNRANGNVRRLTLGIYPICVQIR